ncbi:MAG TPA: AI-2E family transporter [Nocardioides sp.]|jgi:predicted PurR-regulated permease PerM|nr:AI-2E family transporter [Nocardioides sp.]
MTATDAPDDDVAGDGPADHSEVAAEVAVEDSDPAAEHDDLLHDPSQHPDDLGEPGRPLNSRSPFMWGLFGGLGALVALWIGLMVVRISGVLVLVVVALFLAVGLNPAVEFLIRRGVRRPYAVLCVITGVILVFAGFLTILVPIISHQVTEISNHLPGWFDNLQKNHEVKKFDEKYDVTTKVEDYVKSGAWAEKAFGGAVGVGLAILGALLNAFVVVVLTLYFLASLPTMKKAAYSLAPASRRERVSLLGDRILRSIGGYVSGAFVVATCAGISTLVFLFIVGLGGYAVALAMVVALLDVIPMIGATIGAVIVCAIAFATDFKTGIIAVIFYIAYQQVENYVIYPRVMSRSVEIPGALTVVAALVGGTLLGVVGALLAIPTAASILLLVKEVFVPRQEAR